ncbi:hypothetical protein [Amycolatopsis sp. FDAARGOS 1241]|uniref:hypothetical protein n=1 Tax=Amycolatopsis sp. FDAARGOS 1241 TaxID=2778070 RepID=UPI00195231F0|nr:hypothetical protein [Amycolatopsis sp. FDAARGOS 1241]QRP42793.1 hypothetical protein I6J71_25310 [Amycolatopsis sp. FDAARGOS 1241]
MTQEEMDRLRLLLWRLEGLRYGEKKPPVPRAQLQAEICTMMGEPDAEQAVFKARAAAKSARQRERAAARAKARAAAKRGKRMPPPLRVRSVIVNNVGRGKRS